MSAITTGRDLAKEHRILAAIREIRHARSRPYLWRISLYSEVGEADIRRWMRKNGLAFVRGLKGRPPGHHGAWLVVDPARASPVVKELFGVMR